MRGIASSRSAELERAGSPSSSSSNKPVPNPRVRKHEVECAKAVPPRGSPNTSRVSLGSTPPARRGSGGVNIPVTTSTGATARGARGRSSTTAVRSLIPPRGQGVNRAAEDGSDEAPPSYEQASKQTRYDPPTGHPSHPASRLGRQGSTSNQQGQTAPSSATNRATGRPGEVAFLHTRVLQARVG